MNSEIFGPMKNVSEVLPSSNECGSDALDSSAVCRDPCANRPVSSGKFFLEYT